MKDSIITPRRYREIMAGVSSTRAHWEKVSAQMVAIFHATARSAAQVEVLERHFKWIFKENRNLRRQIRRLEKLKIKRK